MLHTGADQRVGQKSKVQNIGFKGILTLQVSSVRFDVSLQSIYQKPSRAILYIIYKKKVDIERVEKNSTSAIIVQSFTIYNNALTSLDMTFEPISQLLIFPDFEYCNQLNKIIYLKTKQKNK